MNYPQHPCRSCIYFKTCGDNTRTAFCAGRTTKMDVKVFDSLFEKNICDLVALRDIKDSEYFCSNRIAGRKNTYQKIGNVSDGVLYCDCNRVAHLPEDGAALVFPIPQEIAQELWEIERGDGQ